MSLLIVSHLPSPYSNSGWVWCLIVVGREGRAKFIAVIRDPRAVCASQIRFFSKRRLHYSTLYWNVHAKYVREVRDEIGRFLVVTYEDFLSSPMEQLRRILEFADLWDPVICRDMLTACPASAKPLGKWRANLSSTQIGLIEGMC